MKNKLMSKPLFILAALVAVGAGIGVSAIASAQTNVQGSQTPHMKGMMDRRSPHEMGKMEKSGGRGMMGMGIRGSISSINGNTVSFTSTSTELSNLKVGENILIIHKK